MRSSPLLPAAFGYDIAVLIVLSLSAFAVASYINDRWLRGERSRFHAVYAATLCGVVCLGLLVQQPALWFQGSWPTWLGLSIAGPILGAFARRCDQSIVRAIERRRRTWQRQVAAPTSADLFPPSRTTRSTSGSTHAVAGKSPSAATKRSERASALGTPSTSYLLLALIGALEEIVHRAILTRFCLTLQDPLAVGLALAGATAMFALSHIEYGWSNVLAKLPLGIGALGITLVTGNVFGAIVMHAWYNLSVAGLIGERTIRPYRRANRRP